MGAKRIDLQGRILKSNIDNIDWNKNVGKSKAIALSNDNLTIYLNGVVVECSPKTLQVLKSEYDIEPKYSFGKREFTATFEVEGSYPVYKLMFGNDLKASKERFKDIREHYYANRNKLMELWQNDKRYRKQRL